MDISPYLATESFSFSWLPTEELQPSNSSNNRLFPSEEDTAHNNYFDFDVSSSSTPSLVHADKLFSNGLIVPGSLNHPYSKSERIPYSATSPGSVALFASPSYNHHGGVGDQTRYSSTKLKRIFQNFTPRRVFSKYLRCLVPVGGSRGRNGIRVDDVNRKAWEVKSYNCSNCNTPQGGISPMRRESDESSIYEAILYCKRSSGSSSSVS